MKIFFILLGIIVILLSLGVLAGELYIGYFLFQFIMMLMGG